MKTRLPGNNFPGRYVYNIRMRVFCVCIIILLIPLYTKAQKENNNWFFGNQAGVSFSSGSPVALNQGISAMNAFEGCATISDGAGNLLFYTDGMKIWNRNHQEMQNGTGLKGHTSSTQSAMIVRMPYSDHLYMVITVNGRSGNSQYGAFYSIVDMRLDNGLGAINSVKNVELQYRTDEKITAVLHQNGSFIWILIPDLNSENINAYLLTDTGFIRTPVSNYVNLSSFGTVGCLKASPDGKRLALCARWPGRVKLLYICNFNALDGRISNGYSFEHEDIYGAEFSPNGRFLYVGAESRNIGIAQYDLDAGSPALVESTVQYMQKTNSSWTGGLQLGPDGKVYFSSFGMNYLGCIPNPDVLYPACGHNENAVHLKGATCKFGIQNYMIAGQIKPGISYKANVSDCRVRVQFTMKNVLNHTVFNWDFGDSLSAPDLNTDTGIQTLHQYSVPARYLVSVSYMLGSNLSMIRMWIDLRNPAFGAQVSLLPDSLFFCEGDTVLCRTEAVGREYRWSTGDTMQQIHTTLGGLYRLNMKDTFGCPQSDSVVLTGKTVRLHLPDDTSICVYDSVSVRELSSASYRSYRWSNGDTLFHTKAGPGARLSLVCTDDLGCMGSDSIQIGLIERPEIDLGPDSVLCEGEEFVKPLSEPGVIYRLQTQPITGSFRTISGGRYIVQAEHNGCLNQDTILLTFLLYPRSGLGQDDTLCFSAPFLLEAGEAEFHEWNTGETTKTISIRTPGTFTVKSGNGRCFVSDTIILSGKDVSLFLPNAFSPNGNEINDVYQLNPELYITGFQVFSQWGECIYSRGDDQAEWDGTYQGKICPQGVYLLKVSYRDCSNRIRYMRQTVHLLR